MNSELEREAFERHMRSIGYKYPAHWHEEDGNYLWAVTKFAWGFWQARAALSTEAQPEVTGAVATVGEPMATGGYRIFADSVYLAKGTKLYPPSAIEAAVREKLEEVVNMIEHTPSLKDPDDTARLIQNKVRALIESPHPSVEEPAN